MFEVCRHPHVKRKIKNFFLLSTANHGQEKEKFPRRVDVLYWDHKPTPQLPSVRQVGCSELEVPLYGSSMVIVPRRVSFS